MVRDSDSVSANPPALHIKDVLVPQIDPPNPEMQKIMLSLPFSPRQRNRPLTKPFQKPHHASHHSSMIRDIRNLVRSNRQPSTRISPNPPPLNPKEKKRKNFSLH